MPWRPVRSWQIWNEVSQPYQFTPQQDWPARYVEVLRTAALAIRREDPRATVVLSGFANDVWNAIGDVYRVGDVRGLFDAVAVHLYSTEPSDFVEVVRRTRETMDLHGDQRKPIWITEIGASASAGKPSAPGHEHFQTTNRGLARLIGPSYRSLAAVRRRYLVERVYWYTWASPYHGGTGVFGYSGLNVFSRGHVKQMPAMAAYRRMARAYEGCRKDARARCVR